MALTDMVIMPGADYQAICDKLRTKTATTRIMTSSEIAPKINAITNEPEVMKGIIEGSLTAYNNPNIEYIGNYAFAGVSSLASIDFPAVKTVGENAFCSTSLQHVAFPNAELIDDNAFENCTSLVSIELPNVTTVEHEAFKKCSALESVSMPNLTSLSGGVFMQCRSLKSVDFPLLTKLAGDTFNGCSQLETVNLPSLTTMNTGGSSMFQNCTSLKSVNFPYVTGIGGYAFRGCTSLESVDLGAVTTMDTYMFNGCTALTSLTIRTTSKVCKIGAYSFNNTPIANGTGYIYVPAALLEDYKVASNWSTYASQILHFDTFVSVVPRGLAGFNSTLSKTVKYYTYDDAASIVVTSNNTSIATVSNVVYSDGNLTFDINTLSTEGTAEITISLTASDGNYVRTFDVIVFETLPEPTYSVETVSGASYGFALNDDGYYESQNAGTGNSAAVCKVTFDTKGIYNLYLDCINYAQSSYDYGILSIVDNTLGLTYTADSGTSVFKSFKGLSKSSVQSVDYGVVENGEHFIYIKFIKNGSTNSYNDSLQFKVRFE